MTTLRDETAPPLVLASQSRFRREMLERAGLVFAVDAAHVDEDEIKLSMKAAGASVEDVAVKLAEHKARRVAQRWPGARRCRCPPTTATTTAAPRRSQR